MNEFTASPAKCAQRKRQKRDGENGSAGYKCTQQKQCGFDWMHQAEPFHCRQYTCCVSPAILGIAGL